MSHSLNASIIDQKYPVRSVHAQQWVNTITSLVFYKFLYFPCLTFKITFPSGQFWLSVNALKHFELFRRYFLRKRVKKRVFDDGLVARRDVNCKKKGRLKFLVAFECRFISGLRFPLPKKVTSALSLQKGFCDWKVVYVHRPRVSL